MIDAGIATDENLAMLTENGFDYICVSRSKIKDYTVDTGSVPVMVEDKRKQKIKTKDKSKICSAQIRVSKIGSH